MTVECKYSLQGGSIGALCLPFITFEAFQGPVAAVFQRVGHYRELETASDELSCAVFEQALANTTQIGVERTHVSGECESPAGV